jgi:hypothetical protein
MQVTFEIKQYRVSLGRKVGGLELVASGTGRCAVIECFGSVVTYEKYIRISFWPAGVELPANVSVINGSKVKAEMNAPAEQYAWYLDLLRNEAPIFAVVTDIDPKQNTLSTTSEPVGEGEL